MGLLMIHDQLSLIVHYPGGKKRSPSMW